jgi:hypothetical protein
VIRQAVVLPDRRGRWPPANTKTDRRGLRRGLPGLGGFTELPGIGHWPNRESPDQFNAALLLKDEKPISCAADMGRRGKSWPSTCCGAAPRKRPDAASPADLRARDDASIGTDLRAGVRQASTFVTHFGSAWRPSPAPNVCCPTQVNRVTADRRQCRNVHARIIGEDLRTHGPT